MIASLSYTIWEEILERISEDSEGMKSRKHIMLFFFVVLMLISTGQAYKEKVKAYEEFYEDSPRIIGVKDLIVLKGSSVDLLSGVTAFDKTDGNLTDKIKVSKVDTSLETSAKGKQTIIYTVTDSHKNTTSVIAYLSVISLPAYKDKKNMGYVAINTLDVYSEPEAGSKKIATLNYGDSVKVVSEVKGTTWVKIKLNNKNGYVDCIYLGESDSYKKGNQKSKISKTTINNVQKTMLQRVKYLRSLGFIVEDADMTIDTGASSDEYVIYTISAHSPEYIRYFETGYAEAIKNVDYSFVSNKVKVDTSDINWYNNNLGIISNGTLEQYIQAKEKGILGIHTEVNSKRGSKWYSYYGYFQGDSDESKSVAPIINLVGPTSNKMKSGETAKGIVTLDCTQCLNPIKTVEVILTASKEEKKSVLVDSLKWTLNANGTYTKIRKPQEKEDGFSKTYKWMFTRLGNYRVVVTDIYGNSATVKFTIKKPQYSKELRNSEEYKKYKAINVDKLSDQDRVIYNWECSHELLGTSIGVPTD